MRLALKFTLAFVLGMCVVLMLYGYSVTRREISMFEADVKHDQSTLGEMLALAVREEWAGPGEAAAMEFIRQADRGEQENQVRVRWRWVEPRGDDPPLPGAVVERLRRGEPAYWVDPAEGRFGSRFTCTPVRIDGRGLGAIQVSESLETERRYTRRTIQNIGITTAAAASVSALLAMLLGLRFVGQPVRRLIQRARAVAAGDLEQRLTFRQRDELRELAEELNAMCDQLAIAQRRIAAETAARIATIEQLRHADRLKTVGELASGIAHELGTPLNVIRARAKMVASGERMVDEARSNAQIIVEQTDRVTRIIRQLLDFARPRSPRRVRTELVMVVEKTVALLSTMAAKRGVRLEVIRGDQLVYGDVDPDQLQQVLSNLVLNGIQAMPQGGTITIELGRTRALPPADHGGPEDEYLRINVQDEGEGIRPENLPRLFEPFFTTKQVGEGTGLGLSVSRGIIHEHGGWISVASEPGRGACFSIFLPPGEGHAGPCADC